MRDGETRPRRRHAEDDGFVRQGGSGARMAMGASLREPNVANDRTRKAVKAVLPPASRGAASHHCPLSRRVVPP